MCDTKNNSLSLSALAHSWSSASWSRIRFRSDASSLCCLQNRSSELFHPATLFLSSVLSFVVGWSSFSKNAPPSSTQPLFLFSLSLSWSTFGTLKSGNKSLWIKNNFQFNISNFKLMFQTILFILHMRHIMCFLSLFQWFLHCYSLPLWNLQCHGKEIIFYSNRIECKERWKEPGTAKWNKDNSACCCFSLESD